MTENNDTLHPLADVTRELKKRRYRLETRRGYLDLLKNVIILVVALVIIFTQVFLVAAQHGTDMYPKLLDGDIVLGYRLDHDYVKNDVVVCSVNGETVISRVVAREGDSVNITEDGKLYVNGTEQAEEISFATLPGDQEYPYIVPEGCVYLLGDYRTNTTDSRDFGPVPVSQIRATVVTVIRRRGV